MEPKKFNNAVTFLNLLRGSFYIMVGIPLMIFIVLFLLYRSNTFDPLYSSFPENLVIAIALIIIFVGITAFIYYFKKLPIARKGVNLREKLTVYYRICFVQFALLSIISVTDLVLYLISGHQLFAGAYILLLIMLALNNPSYHNVVGNLRLSKEEREIMKNNQTIT